MRSFIALGTLALASTILAKPLTYHTKTDTTGKEPQGLAPELPSRHVTLAKRSPLDAQHLRSPSDFADTHELYRYGSDEIPSNVKVVELNNNGTASNKTLPQKSNPDLGYSAQFDSQNPPEPIRGSNGAPFLHESNTAIDYQNPDGLAAPPTDAGTVPNLKWSFSLSHTRLLKGGWVREQAITDLPPSKDVAAAELRLAPGAYRELHWHRTSEWAIVLNGSARIAAVDENGKNTISNVGQGDLWYFPEGVGHSIEALDQGVEFLVIFDDGNFDASGTTFMLSDFLARVPKEILAHNFGVNASTFDNIPQKDPYILPGPNPVPSIENQTVKSPYGEVDNPYVYKLSQVNATKAKGGWVKITDSSNFKVSETIASALVHVDVGGLRELHWHAKDEWVYFISGKGRVTVFTGGSTARTFDFQAGDTGVFPVSTGHYVENLGDEPLVFIEIFKAKKYVDFSVTQWLALTPYRVTADLLNTTEAFVASLPKEKQIIV